MSTIFSLILQIISIFKLQGSQAYAHALQRAGLLTETEEQAIQDGLKLVNTFNCFMYLEKRFVEDCCNLCVLVSFSSSDTFALA
jgi:hypothetical protein